jgi:hypothetical protein
LDQGFRASPDDRPFQVHAILISERLTGAAVNLDKLISQEKRATLGVSAWQYFYLYSFWLPAGLVYCALFSLVIIAYHQFFSLGNFSPVLTLYLTAIGLAIALSSVTFNATKLRQNEEKEFLTGIGELFLHGALNLIISLLVCWLVSQFNNPLSKTKHYSYFKWLLFLVFTSGQIFLFGAANSLHRAIVDLDGYLLNKIQQKNLWKVLPFRNQRRE